MEYLADTVTVIRHFSETGKIGKKAIEQNEETAKEWIKMQIQDLEINLNDEK